MKGNSSPSSKLLVGVIETPETETEKKENKKLIIIEHHPPQKRRTDELWGRKGTKNRTVHSSREIYQEKRRQSAD